MTYFIITYYINPDKKLNHYYFKIMYNIMKGTYIYVTQGMGELIHFDKI